MKNLVDIGSIAIDFDLKQLLRKRFVADELSMLDVNSGTERKYSGELPPNRKNKAKRNNRTPSFKKQKEKPVFFLFVCFLFLIWPCHTACGTLVP